jgi:hypothetical protein
MAFILVENQQSDTMAKKRKRPKQSQAEEAKEETKEETKVADDDWESHPAKFFLRKGFYEGTILMEYMTKEGGPGPRAIWDQHCKNNPLFEGMEYGDSFTSRLRSVRNHCQKKLDRVAADQEAFDNFRALYPRPTHDHKGVILWDGSDAQRFLKQMVEEGKHLGKAPKELWENDNDLWKSAFQVFSLEVFRKHIYQELRLKKHKHYLEVEGKNNAEED